MKVTGQVENAQFGCKVDNKYDAIADSDDPFDALEQLSLGTALSKDLGTKNGKVKSASSGDKQVANASGSARKSVDTKKEVVGTNKPQSAVTGKKQDANAKKHQEERTNVQERPKTAGDKPASGDAPNDLHRSSAASRGKALPRQAGVVGLMKPNVSATAMVAAAGEEDHTGASENADGFQSQRSGSGGYRGRRGGPRGAGFGPNRYPRGGFGGPRPERAPFVADNGQEANPAANETARLPVEGTNNEFEADDRLERNFENRQRLYDNNRGQARRGGFRRGNAFTFEAGTGRKREFERHSGSVATGVKAVDKKDGGGPHNWGTVQDDLAVMTEGAEGEQVEKRTGSAVKEAKAGEAWTDLVNADETAKAAEGVGAEGAQQDKMYILDDWKAKEEKERYRVPEFRVRKPNEGVDESAKWGGFVLKKRENEAQPVEPDEEFDNAAHGGAESGDDAKRKGKQRVAIPVKFAVSGQGRGSYGSGRGGVRGTGEYRNGGNYCGGYDRSRGGNRGGNRGDRAAGGPQSGAPQLTIDEFPSLNKHAA